MSRLFVLFIIQMVILIATVHAGGTGDLSHPLVKDTDGDGMPDDWELRYGLDPKSASDAAFDYNNDGLTNFEEHKKNKNPLERDVDGDGIDNLAERMGYLGFVTDPFNKDTDEDGLTDLEEVVMLIDLNNKSQVRWIYKPVGIDRGKKKRITKMQDTQKAWIYPWRHDTQNLSATWILDPTNPDSDGDGLKDGEEVDKYEFDPNINDSTVDLDSDALDNIREVLNLTTDPRKGDTDGDGLTDGVEVLGRHGVKTDPKTKDTDGDGVADMEEVLGLAPISPSKHAITYELFMSGDHYAGDYITMMAKVKKVRRYVTSDAYDIALKSTVRGGSANAKGRYGVVHVGNPWHSDIGHKEFTTDDTFGFTLRPDDVIVICGKADKFQGSTRAINVNCRDSSGTIFLVLDPQEKKNRWLPSESHVKMRKNFERINAPSPVPTPTPAPTPAPTIAPEPTPASTPAPPEEDKTVFMYFGSVIDYLTPWKSLF